VCVLEKGSEVGAHILSGAVIDPKALTELIPDWKDKGAPLATPVAADRFVVLTAKRAFAIPHWTMPRMLSNHGSYIVSLGNVCRWLGQQAEAAGVEIYPGFPAAEVLYNDDGSVAQVIANCTTTGTTPPAGETEALACTGAGTKDAQTNLVTSNTYDATGRLVAVEAPDPSATTGTATGTVTTQYAYDAASRLCRVVENTTTNTNMLSRDRVFSTT